MINRRPAEGSFVCELTGHGLITPRELVRKYNKIVVYRQFAIWFPFRAISRFNDSDNRPAEKPLIKCLTLKNRIEPLWLMRKMNDFLIILGAIFWPCIRDRFWYPAKLLSIDFRETFRCAKLKKRIFSPTAEITIKSGKLLKRRGAAQGRGRRWFKASICKTAKQFVEPTPGLATYYYPSISKASACSSKSDAKSICKKCWSAKNFYGQLKTHTKLLHKNSFLKKKIVNFKLHHQKFVSMEIVWVLRMLWELINIKFLYAQ